MVFSVLTIFFCYLLAAIIGFPIGYFNFFLQSTFLEYCLNASQSTIKTPPKFFTIWSRLTMLASV